MSTMEEATQRMEMGIDDDEYRKECDYEAFTLPASTHSFLFTEPIRSLPFAFGIGIAAISCASLALALINNITSGSIPTGVDVSVRIAQYLCEY